MHAIVITPPPAAGELIGAILLHPWVFVAIVAFWLVSCLVAFVCGIMFAVWMDSTPAATPEDETRRLEQIKLFQDWQESQKIESHGVVCCWCHNWTAAGQKECNHCLLTDFEGDFDK